MADEKTTRAYRMQRRAELQDETRRRITESAVALHGSVGPSQTSISAVAAMAGVRRSTLYRHFPDEAALFDACTAHWTAANPLPDIGAWAAVPDPHARLRLALTELHGYYARCEQMLDNLIRDEPLVPLVAERFAVFHSYMGAACATLMQGRSGRGRAGDRLRAALGHAIAFSTWKSLVRERGLDAADAEELLCRLVAAA